MRFLLLFALILATEALAWDLSTELGLVRNQVRRGQGATVVGRLQVLAYQEQDSAEVHGLLGLALWQSADPEKVGPQEAQRLKQQAVDELQVTVRLNPGLVEAWDAISDLLEQRGDFERAAEAKLQLLRLEPNEPWRLSTYLDLVRKTGRPGAVIQALRAWVVEQPNSGDAYFSLGLQLEEAGQDDEAVAAYRRAVQLRRGDSAFAYLGGLLGKQGRWEEARAAFAQGYKTDRRSYAIYGQGVAYAKLGKVELARQMLVQLENADEPRPGFIRRLQAVIQDPKIEPALGIKVSREP